MSKNVVFAAGGTGGHLYPAIAVAEYISMPEHGSWKASFIGTAHRIEGRVVPSRGFDFYPIHVTSIKGLSLQTLLFPFTMLRAILHCRTLLQRLQPAVVVCAGAYISYPVGIAAKLLSIPLVLMESNVQPGKALKALAGSATAICTAFAESTSHFPPSVHGKITDTGNPVRRELFSLPNSNQAKAALGFPTDKPVTLFFGGSLGARTINQAAEKFIEQTQGSCSVLWQTGKSADIPVMSLPENVWRGEYIEDMATAYAAADIIVCRAGATTLAELSAVQKPAILMPYPLAAADHQTHNARAFQNAEAAVMVPDSEADKVPALISTLLADENRLRHLKNNLVSFSRPAATKNIAEIIMNVAKFS